MPQAIDLKVARTDTRAVVPAYSREGDAGLDLCALDTHTIEPFQRTLIATGIRMAIPAGYAGLVLPRSGHALKKGLTLVNAPGLIDANYRGDIGIIAYNSDPEHAIEIAAGERVAQLLIQEVPQVQVSECEISQLDDTVRGDAGFGSSGA
ncbi:MAG: dUTP diphosphatase [Coriobacteriia bacterium]|nr:dUTP diphosphatase [Coriobacteriia bacterium]MCL2536968.1 dUTP diphosphatase [Coriobacteriia bacterium]